MYLTSRNCANDKVQRIYRFPNGFFPDIYVVKVIIGVLRYLAIITVPIREQFREKMTSALLTVLVIAATLAVGQDTCPGYAASNVQTSDIGLTADLTLAGTACNIYGTDIVNLTLTVEYQTSTHVIRTGSYHADFFS